MKNQWTVPTWMKPTKRTLNKRKPDTKDACSMVPCSFISETGTESQNHGHSRGHSNKLGAWVGQLAAICHSRCWIEGCVHCAKIQSCALTISFFFWYITFYVILLRKWIYYGFFSFLKAPSSWHLTKHFKWLIIDGESLLRCKAHEVFSCTCCFLYVRNEDRTLGFSFMKRIWTRLMLNEWVHILQIPNCTTFFPKERCCWHPSVLLVS